MIKLHVVPLSTINSNKTVIRLSSSPNKPFWWMFMLDKFYTVLLSMIKYGYFMFLIFKRWTTFYFFQSAMAYLIIVLLRGPCSNEIPFVFWKSLRLLWSVKVGFFCIKYHAVWIVLCVVRDYRIYINVTNSFQHPTFLPFPSYPPVPRLSIFLFAKLYPL